MQTGQAVHTMAHVALPTQERILLERCRQRESKLAQWNVRRLMVVGGVSACNRAVIGLRCGAAFMNKANESAFQHKLEVRPGPSITISPTSPISCIGRRKWISLAQVVVRTLSCFWDRPWLLTAPDGINHRCDEQHINLVATRLGGYVYTRFGSKLNDLARRHTTDLAFTRHLG